MKSVQTKYFTACYENGAIRQVKLVNVEVVRMIYSAVRDQNWGTIEPEVLAEKITQNENGFQIETEVRYNRNDIHFEANYLIVGEGNRLVFEMIGEAKSTFKSNRIGFCVLHPIKECSGKEFKITQPDGSEEINFFPEQVAAFQPMKNITEMHWKPAESIGAKLTFSGDIFEMEDQRNWTDASYKTYCRPLDLPFPFQIEKGEKIEQKIELEIITDVETNADNKGIAIFNLDKTKTFKLPEIGTETTSRNEELTSNEAAILKELPFDHLRAEIKLFEKNRGEKLAKINSEAIKLELPLFLVLYLTENFVEELKQLSENLNATEVSVKNVLVVGKNHLPDDAIFDAVFPGLKKLFPQAKIGTGVNAYFAELNRYRPQSKEAEFISFIISPQVHAFDNFSLVENLEAQKYAVESAKLLFPIKPIYVSPITLKQRFNVVSTSEETQTPPGELPPQVDPRQNSIFAAQWLLGSLKFLAQSGADFVTFFETVGWQGFVQGDFESSIPEKFSAKKGDVFPVFNLLKEFAGYREVVFSESNSPLEVDGIVLKRTIETGENYYKMLITNFSAIPKKVNIPGLKGIKFFQPLFGKSSIKAFGGTIEIPANEIMTFERTENHTDIKTLKISNPF